MSEDDLPTARPLIPVDPTLERLQEVARTCTACDLYRNATQTVFGKGLPGAEVVFVGEQPGDREDLAGEPFVGPAGRLLDQALREAVIDRSTVYITNAVKHFKWEPRGKFRLHKTPSPEEVTACFPWLEAELAVIRPRVLVVLGATAGKALLGPAFRVTRQRGTLIDSGLAPTVTATVHPSSILRAPDERAKAEQYDAFVADLRFVAKLIASVPATPTDRAKPAQPAASPSGEPAAADPFAADPFSEGRLF